MRSLVKQEDASLLALITKAYTGTEVVAEAAEPAPAEVIAENADPADPNDHDMNAVASLHTGNIYHHAANLIADHGVSGELHDTLIAGLRKLGNEHQADYAAHAAKGTQSKDAHEDISHHMTLDALTDLARHHQNSRG